MDKKQIFSKEDLKGNLFKSLQVSGVYDELKSHLRKSMVKELMTKNSLSKKLKEEKSSLISATIHKRAEPCWTQKVLDNLVLHHIKKSKYHYTFSLFQQESSVKKYSKSLTVEMLEKLGLKPEDFSKSKSLSTESSINSSISTNSSSVAPQQTFMMWEIMQALVNCSNIKLAETCAQNDPLTLADKLMLVDEDYRMRLTNLHANTSEDQGKLSVLHNRVQQAEKDCENRYKRHLEEWKVYELSKMRKEESEKSRKEIDARVSEIAKDYAEQKKALENREKNAIERLTNHKNTLEGEIHIQRQKLLQEMQNLKSREELLEQQECHINKMESLKLKQLNALKTTISREDAQNDCKALNEVFMNQIDDLSKENSRLKEELFELKKIIAKEVSEKEEKVIEEQQNQENIKEEQENANEIYEKQNARLQSRIEEIENAMIKMKSEKENSNTRSKTPDKELQMQVNELKKMKEEQNVKQIQLENMIKRMRDTVDENLIAMQKNELENSKTKLDQSFEHSKTPTYRNNPALATNLPYKSNISFASDNLTNQVEDSQQIDRPLFDVCYNKERIKSLIVETETIQKEYEKYNEFDFERKLSETKRKYFSNSMEAENYERKIISTKLEKPEFKLSDISENFSNNKIECSTTNSDEVQFNNLNGLLPSGDKFISNQADEIEQLSTIETEMKDVEENFVESENVTLENGDGLIAVKDEPSSAGKINQKENSAGSEIDEDVVASNKIQSNEDENKPESVEEDPAKINETGDESSDKKNNENFFKTSSKNNGDVESGDNEKPNESLSDANSNNEGSNLNSENIPANMSDVKTSGSSTSSLSFHTSLNHIDNEHVDKNLEDRISQFADNQDEKNEVSEDEKKAANSERSENEDRVVEMLSSIKSENNLVKSANSLKSIDSLDEEKHNSVNENNPSLEGFKEQTLTQNGKKDKFTISFGESSEKLKSSLSSSIEEVFEERNENIKKDEVEKFQYSSQNTEPSSKLKLDDLKKPAEFSEKSEVKSIEKVKPVQEISNESSRKDGKISSSSSDSFESCTSTNNLPSVESPLSYDKSASKSEDDFW